MSTKEEIRARKFYDNENQTGLDRLKIFYKDVYNNTPRAEFNFIFDATIFSFCGGAFWRSLFGSNTIIKDFHRKHNASVFLGKTDLRKQLKIFTFESIFTRGVKFGTKCATLTGVISFLTVHSFIYRKEFRIIDFSAAVALGFGLTRYNRGLRSFLSASAIGLIGGLFSGLLIKGTMLYKNISMKDYLDEINKELNVSEIVVERSADAK